MQSLRRIHLLTWLALGIACLLPASEVQGQKDKTEKPQIVKFKSHDGVHLEGALYPNPNGKKNAVVLLLHDFSAKKGGSSTKGNFPEFAKQLQDAGYSVMTFDFRGFGDSKSVGNSFLNYTHNFNGVKGINKAKPPETIEHKNFKDAYFINLVHDIAAAKAYLDRASDRGEVNSHSTIVIGAGQGAALGSLWVANENRRRKGSKTGFGAISDEPESRDIAACIWLTITPKVEGRSFAAQQQRLLAEVAKYQKIPMGFYYGKKDGTGETVAANIVKAMDSANKDIGQKAPIDDTSASGSELLLDKSTRNRIVKKLASILEARGPRENKKHESEEHAFYYALPGRKVSSRLSKKPGDEVGQVELGLLVGGF